MSKYIKLDDAIKAVSACYAPLDCAPVREVLNNLPCVEIQPATVMVRHSNNCVPPMSFIREQMAKAFIELAAKSGCIKITKEPDPYTRTQMYFGKLMFEIPEGATTEMKL